MPPSNDASTGKINELLTWARCVMDSAYAGVWRWNLQTGEACFNERWAEAIGYRLAELGPASPACWETMVHPDDFVQRREYLEEHLGGKTAFYALDIRMRHRQGHWVWLREYGSVISWNSENSPEWLVGIHLDISDDKQRQLELQSELDKMKGRMQRLEDAQRLGKLGYWEMSGATGRVYWSDIVYAILGLDRDTVLPSHASFMAMVHPQDLPQVEEHRQRALVTGAFDMKHRIIRPDGSIRWVHEYAENTRRGDGDVLVGTLRDITEQQEVENKLRRQSITDELTGLFNRRYFIRRLKHAFSYYQRTGRVGIVMLFDLDNFKIVNDTYGHAMGDQVLKTMGSVLNSRLRETDVSGRLGGEEFAVLLFDITLENAVKLANEIRESMAATPFTTASGEVFYVTITGGVAGFTDGDGTKEAILQRADESLYVGKSSGRNNIIASQH